MYVCLCVYLCAFIYECVFVYASVSVHVFVHACLCNAMYVYNVFTRTCACVGMYVYICVYRYKPIAMLIFMKINIISKLGHYISVVMMML